MVSVGQQRRVVEGRGGKQEGLVARVLSLVCPLWRAVSEWNERAFDLPTDLTKQLLTLSTCVVTLSIAFLKDIASEADLARPWLVGSWGVLVLSVLAGVGVLMASLGSQGTSEVPASGPSVFARNLRVLGGVQIGCFVLGLVLTAVAVTIGT